MASSNTFEGVVVGVPSSFRIVVQPKVPKAPLMTLIPACIRVPSGNDEPLSFAARDTIRKQFLGQDVLCSHVKEHARIKRLQDGLDVTVSLVRSGLATCSEADRVYNDFAQHKRELIELQETAIRRGVGLHDPCLRGASTLRRLQPFPTRKEDPHGRQQIIKAIVNSQNTFRLSVEKVITATNYAGYLMPSLQSVGVKLLGLKPPRSDNLSRTASQRIGTKLLHRVVTVVVHGFDEDTDEFIVELTSATYKKLFGELTAQGLLLTDKSLQLPAALEAFNQDRELLMAEHKEQASQKQQSAITVTAAKAAGPNTPAFAPAGLGADSGPNSHNVSAKRSPASRPKPPAQRVDPLNFSPDNGIDIAINFGSAFATEGTVDPFLDVDADRQVARMAADLVGDLLGPGNAARPFAISPDQHPSTAIMVPEEEVMEPLPPIQQIEDRLPWRERLSAKGSRFRRGLVIGVRNEVTIDVVEERIIYPRSGGRGGRRGGKPQKQESARPTVAREFFKIRIAGLGAPSAFEEIEDPNEAITVVLSAKGLAIRESVRRMLIGKEVQFSLTDGSKQNPDNSVTANVYVAMRERTAPVGGSAPTSPTVRRRGWMDVSHYARCVANISEIDKILEEEALESSSSSSSEDEAEPKVASSQASPTSAADQGAGTVPQGLSEEDEEPLEDIMSKGECSLFDLNRFNRMLQRGAPTNEELGALLQGTWAVKPNLVPLAPLMPLGEAPISAKTPAPTTVDASPARPSNEVSLTVSRKDATASIEQPTTVSPTELATPTEDPRIEISYVSQGAFIKSLQHLGSSVPGLLKQQHVAAVIEEFTAPLSLSIYVPALGVQLPFELKHAFLPPVNLEQEASPATPAPEKEKGGKGKRRGKGGKGKEPEPIEEPKSAYPPLTDRERSVYHEIYNFLDDILVHRDCWIYTDEIDTKRRCLLGSIVVPFSQLPLRWQSRLEPTKVSSLDGEVGISEAAASPYAGEPVVDVLHAMVTLGMCAITPSEAVAQMPLELISQIVAAQEAAKEKRSGIWDTQCPTLQDIAKALQRPVSSQIEPLITAESPRPTTRARKIKPLKYLDPMSFLFRYDDKQAVDQQAELQELLKGNCRALPRSSRVHPGDYVVIAKRADKPTTSNSGKGKKDDQGKSKDKEPAEDKDVEGTVTYHRAKIVSRVVMHHCNVDYLDSLETDVRVHLREIRLADEEGKITAFPPSVLVGRHSYVQLSEEGKRLLAQKQEDDAQSPKDLPEEEDSGKKGPRRGDKRGNRHANKHQDKAHTLQKEFDNLVAYATKLAAKDVLFFSADYKTGDEVYGFTFESDKKGSAPDASIPPATVELVRSYPHMVSVDTSLADESSAFVPFLWHLIDVSLPERSKMV